MTGTRHAFRGRGYRTCAPAWSHDVASGTGASRVGGRFNPRGTKALYLSLDEVTAVREGQQGFINRPQPYTWVAFDVDCGDLVDLTTKTGRTEVNTSLEELRCPWRRLLMDGRPVPTHELAKRLIADGVAGVFVPSFAVEAHHDAINLVLWAWGENPPHRAVMIDDYGRLPHGPPSP